MFVAIGNPVINEIILPFLILEEEHDPYMCIYRI